METPRNASSNAYTATRVVDMAQENGVGTGWMDEQRSPSAETRQVDKSEDTVDDACARHAYEYYTLVRQTMALVPR